MSGEFFLYSESITAMTFVLSLFNFHILQKMNPDVMSHCQQVRHISTEIYCGEADELVQK